MEYRENWSPRQKGRIYLGRSIVRFVGADEDKRVRIGEQVERLQVRHTLRNLAYEIAYTVLLGERHDRKCAEPARLVTGTAVSYTHLDVYKRQR